MSNGTSRGVYKLFIGVDLGGTNIAVGLVDDVGAIKKVVTTPTKAPRSAEAIGKDIVKMCNALIDYVKSEGMEEVRGIGVGVPGPVDEKLASVYVCVNLGWKDVNLKEMIEAEIELPVLIDNDANLATLAEFEVGALVGAQNAILMTLGTGVGGGIVANGKMYRGSHGLGTEIGHVFMGENFYDCNCGQNGCLETFASATAIVKYTEKLLNDYELETPLRGYYDNNKLSAKVIIDAAKAGDRLASMSVDRFIKYLAIQIGSLITLLDPDIIALGGGVSHAGDYLLDRIHQVLPKYMMMKGMAHAKIKIAETGNDAGIIGAAFLPKFELDL